MLNWINKKMKKRKGFTLVELVVVIAILGILASIAVPRLSSSKKEAEKVALDATIRTLNGAVSMYLADEEANNDKVITAKDLKDATTAKEAYATLVEAELIQDTLKEADLDVTISYDKNKKIFTKTEPINSGS